MGRTVILEKQHVRTNFWLENLKGRDEAGELDLDGILIIWEFIRKQYMSLWTRLIWLRTRIQ
jgi:hypothetical protein